MFNQSNPKHWAITLTYTSPKRIAENQSIEYQGDSWYVLSCEYDDKAYEVTLGRHPIKRFDKHQTMMS